MDEIRYSSVPSLSLDLREPIICQVPDNRDLLTLCLVSRAFRFEAERFLHRRIILPPDYNRILSWFARITAEPSRLSPAVRSLTLPFYVEVDLSQQQVIEYQASLARSLRLLKILTELNIDQPGQWCRSRTTVFAMWVLEDCPFRLRKYRVRIEDHMFDFRPSLRFLSQHPDIYDFSTIHYAVENAPPDSPLPVTVIPNLLIVEVLRLWSLRDLLPRPIKRLHVETWFSGREDVVPFSLLGQLGSSLTHLRLGYLEWEGTFISDLAAHEFTNLLPRLIPKLQLLDIFITPPVRSICSLKTVTESSYRLPIPIGLSSFSHYRP
jgi:hypothetical protein